MSCSVFRRCCCRLLMLALSVASLRLTVSSVHTIPRTSPISDRRNLGSGRPCLDFSTSSSVQLEESSPARIPAPDVTQHQLTFRRHNLPRNQRFRRRKEILAPLSRCCDGWNVSLYRITQPARPRNDDRSHRMYGLLHGRRKRRQLCRSPARIPFCQRYVASQSSSDSPLLIRLQEFSPVSSVPPETWVV